MAKNSEDSEDIMMNGRKWPDRNPPGLFAAAESSRYLDTAQLAVLEKSFRLWMGEAVRRDVRFSRRRIMLVFLLIRYTGARLGEVLAMDSPDRIDTATGIVRLGGEVDGEGGMREVEIPAELARELADALADPDFAAGPGELFHIDPAHVRRKFYERAEACGFSKELGNPSTIRRSRAIELLRNNMPLPIVQKILGHSTPSLTTAYIDVSDEEMKAVVRHYIDRESRRTSARNTFYGKIDHIRPGDIQAGVRIRTLGGHVVTTVITNESVARLGLKEGIFVTAEVKAPWVIVAAGENDPPSSAENRFPGRVNRIHRGAVTSEVIVTLEDGTDVCAVITEESRKILKLGKGDPAWVLFGAFSVILNVD